MAQTAYKNRREAADYLIENGWKISRSTFYNHCRSGLLKPNKEGIFTRAAVEKYATLHLERIETGQKVEDDDLQRKLKQAELEKVNEQAMLHKFKRLTLEGKYKLQDEVDMENAAKAAALEATLKHMFQSRAGDWIALVEGNDARTGDLIREMISGLDEALNEFASMREFQVVFKAQEA